MEMKSKVTKVPSPNHRLPGLFHDGTHIYLVTKHTNGRYSPVVGRLDGKSDGVFTTYTSADVLSAGKMEAYKPYYGEVTIECLP